MSVCIDLSLMIKRKAQKEFTSFQARLQGFTEILEVYDFAMLESQRILDSKQ